MTSPTDAELDAARLRGDPVADRVVAELGDAVWTVNALMRGHVGNGAPLPSTLPEAARRFFEDECRPPAWLDRARVADAQRWSSEHLLHITTALFHASLPNAYAAEKGVRVLAATGRMSGDLDRRVNETARFVLDVITPGSFEASGKGIRAVQQVRLVHAAVRRTLGARLPADAEVPLNQEDLLGTLFAFSVVVVGAVRRLGVEVSQRDAEDFYHLWSGVGSLLGIEEELLPRDVREAGELAARIGKRHFRACPEGKLLMKVLRTRIDEHVFMPGLTNYLVRRLSGDHVADLLDVPDDSQFRALFSRVARLPFVSRLPAQDLLLKVTPWVGQPLLSSIVFSKLGGAHRGYEMPLGAPSSDLER